MEDEKKPWQGNRLCPRNRKEFGMKTNIQFKRLTCLALVLVMVFVFGGCETTQPVSAETNLNETPETSGATQEATAASDASVSTSQDAANTSPTETGEAEAIPVPAPSTPASSANNPSGGNNNSPHTHSHSAANTVSASCDNQGYTIYKCSCGDSYKDNYTGALGHNYSSTVVEPTKESQGYTQHTCSRCGNSYKDNYTDKLPQYTAAEYESLVIQYVLQYLNEHRASVGAPALTRLSGMSQVADYRATQLTSNFEHVTADIREAHAYYQYGRYVDATLFGHDVSYSYYTADAGEAICSVWDYGDPQRLAKEIADGFRASAPHWSYLGNAQNIFAGIGVAFYNNYCYGCIMVGTVNYG